MFNVFDTCARFRLGEIDANEAVKKLKSKHFSTNQLREIVIKYFSVLH